jgi:hypothetical protein
MQNTSSPKKVAIAGTGCLARYFIEEFICLGHELLVVTRTHKSFLDEMRVTQRVTDYTVNDLHDCLDDCDAVLSFINAPYPTHTEIHLNILQACRLSRKCKRFIPAEWAINIEDYPEHPMFNTDSREPIREALKRQNEIQYTFVCNGWFMDYIVPVAQRYISEIGEGWPMNHEQKVFMLYGDGHSFLSLTSCRDLAKAIAILLDHSTWEEYTHISGHTLTYLDLFTMIQARDRNWILKKTTLADVVNRIVEAKSTTTKAKSAQLQLMGFVGCNSEPEAKVKAQRDTYFSHMRFRNIHEFLDQALAHPEEIP